MKKKLITQYNKKQLKIKLSMKKVKVHIKKIVIKNKDKINKTWDFKIKKRAPKVFRKIVKKNNFQTT